MRQVIIALAGGLILLGAAPAEAQCRNSESFQAWLDGFRREAAAAGVSQNTIAAALGNVAYDERVVARDRRQAVFAQSFLEFSDRMVAAYRLQQGAANIRRHADTFARIEQQFGVPAPVIVAFWGLGTDFGANLGDFNTLSALASLAYDCRRPEKFRPQLLDALRIIDRGDLRPADMRGAWAGELGQMQFLPSDYMRSAIDYDGDGRRDLLRSAPDALASSASLLRDHGWQPNEPWLVEVRVPQTLPWDQADLRIKHPVGQWAAWGVQRADGRPLGGNLAASLILPMGRNGPAFLAFRNFDVYLNWNESLIYALTAAYFATRLDGAPPVRRGGATDGLSFEQTKELQRLLRDRGYDVGGVDGILGANTRAAVKDVQARLGLPADSYPTGALLARLRAGR